MTVIDLVGPKGYIHGWIFVGVPAPGDKVNIPGHGRGRVISGNVKHARVRLVSGHIAHIAHDGDSSKPGRLTARPSAAPAPKEEESDLRKANRAQAAASLAKGGETLFHGTNHEFKPGDIIDANHANSGVTALHEGKKYAFASTDAGEATFAGKASREGHVYRVEPVGDYEFDPHQGSATSRRTTGGFRVVEEVKKWSGEKMDKPFDFKSLNKAQKKAYVSKGIVPAGMAAPPRRVQAHSNRQRAVELTGRTGAYRPPPPGWKPTTKLKQRTVKSMRNLARNLKDDHPGMGMHLHVSDAAAALERNNSQAAVRHLTAAVGNATPQSLRRHGIVTDEEHSQAKANMDAVHRHMLMIKELQDHEAHNQNLAAISRQATEDAQGGPDKGEPNQMEGYGPGRLSAVPTARNPASGNAAMNAPKGTPTGGTDKNTVEPVQITNRNTKQIAASWADVENAIELATIGLSAQTGRLATEPSPLGKPGGPGLWHVKNMELPPYIQHIAKALMAKRGMSESQAIATARAATKRWIHGKNTKPEVRAASGLSDAQWREKQANAHAHSNSWADAERAIELATIGLAHDGYLKQPRGKDGKWVHFLSDADKIDRADVAQHRTADRAVADRSLRAAPGSPEHAQELRGLAAQAELQQGRNYISLRSSAEGTTSRDATSIGAGSDRGNPPSSDAARVMRRAAALIERNQPALARVHAGALRTAAAHEAVGNPAFRDRLNAAADKLDALPRKGLGGDLPSESADETARTAAARAYAARTAPRAAPRTPPKIVNPGGRNMMKLDDTPDYQVREGTKPRMGDVLPPGVRRGPGGRSPSRGMPKAATSAQKAALGRQIQAARKLGLSAAEIGGIVQNFRIANNLSNSWADAERSIELAVLLAIPANGSGGGGRTTSNGSGGEARNPQGEFTSGSGGAASAKGKKAEPTTKTTGSTAARKSALLKTAAGDRAKANGLIKQRNTLQSELASASGQTNSGQSGSTTSGQSGSTTASNATATTAATTTGVSTASSSSASLNTSASSNALKAQIATLNGQINTLLTAAAAATSQANSLGAPKAKAA